MVTTWWNPIIHCQDDMGCTFLLFLHIWKKTENMYSVPFLYSAVLYVAIVQEGVSPWTCTCASRHVHMTSLNNINRTFTGLKGKMKYCGHFNRNIQTHQKCSLIKKKQNKGSNCFETRAFLYILTKKIMEYILPAIRELPSRQKEAATYPYNPKVRNRLERSSERSDKAGPISSLRKIRQRVPRQ